MAENIEELKKQIFYDLLNIAGRVFIVVRNSDAVMIGKRGFLQEEKEKGLVLVFNRSMNFTWDEEGISVTLVFGTSPEKCYIPQKDISNIFSPELNAQFSVVLQEQDTADEPEKKQQAKDQKVVRVDFNKRINKIPPLKHK